MSTFGSLLQQAYWRGMPFKVRAEEVRKGRKLAIHDYPFRDSAWAEDMGRAQAVYQFTGYLIGDFASVMQLALDAVCEMPGPGLLIHPSIGAVRVSLVTHTSAIRVDHERVIEVEFTFIEQGDRLFPSIVTQTIQKVVSAVGNFLPAISTDLIGYAVGAASLGFSALSEGEAVVKSFSGYNTTIAADPAGLVGMATALPPPDANTTYGRYAVGRAISSLPLGTTVASLQAQLAEQRSTVTAAGLTAASAAAGFNALTAAALVADISALVEAVRATMNDPADQIRTLLVLSTFTYADNQGGAGASGDIVTVRDGMASACRRCALGSLALASAAYQPTSYDDAANTRRLLAAALDVEITAAGDLGQDATFTGLSALRAAVIQDLTARGASLPTVQTVQLPASLPTLVAAYRLYQDTTRADQIAAETDVVHPAFLPLTIQVLAT